MSGGDAAVKAELAPCALALRPLGFRDCPYIPIIESISVHLSSVVKWEGQWWLHRAISKMAGFLKLLLEVTY